MAPKKNSNLLYDTFVGEMVVVVTEATTKRAEQVEDHFLEESTPIAIQGYLLDADDIWLYIGKDANEVSSAIHIDKIIEISIIDMYDQILDDFPDNDSGLN